MSGNPLATAAGLAVLEPLDARCLRGAVRRGGPIRVGARRTSCRPPGRRPAPATATAGSSGAGAGGRPAVRTVLRTRRVGRTCPTTTVRRLRRRPGSTPRLFRSHAGPGRGPRPRAPTRWRSRRWPTGTPKYERTLDVRRRGRRPTASPLTRCGAALKYGPVPSPTPEETGTVQPHPPVHRGQNGTEESLARGVPTRRTAPPGSGQDEQDRRAQIAR